ncbi:MAG: RdgB/HAM1 family non-canonical purine NTP pyrophosphatase [Bacteriovoracaceae bacterium]|nr:RdgB/HAM1 family non-canonical purine NTP pyrophosphatase [Bacteriovoracaceae bacterium]
MKLYLASSNQHKAQEFAELFDESISVSAAPSALEVEENGSTFHENAFAKAKAYFDKFKSPVMADDSGLVIEEMPDIMGVQSANFAPETKDYSVKVQKLLEMTKNLKNRKAYFVCVLCFYLSDDEIFFFEGRLLGSLAQEAKGAGGFGYDPVFVPEGENFSLADAKDWKKQHSHRAKAVQFAMKFFRESNCQNS